MNLQFIVIKDLETNKYIADFKLGDYSEVALTYNIEDAYQFSNKDQVENFLPEYSNLCQIIEVY